MADSLGTPPSAPGGGGDAVAECTECGNTIRSDVKRCSACGARQWTKGQAALLIVASLPLWSVTLGSLDMLGAVDNAFAQGFLIGMSMIGPAVTLGGVAKWRDRDRSLRAGSGNGVS